MNKTGIKFVSEPKELAGAGTTGEGIGGLEVALEGTAVAGIGVDVGSAVGTGELEA